MDKNMSVVITINIDKLLKKKNSNNHNSLVGNK